jgi:alpha/beta superfamily hydrolase
MSKINHLKQTKESLVIVAADGHRIPAVVQNNDSDRLVIMSHGITTNRDEDGIYTIFANYIVSHGIDSIRFDFRGHGESAMDSHNVTISGEILDLMAVVRWARQQKYTQLFHLATSFGASITLLSIKRFSFDDFAAIVFWNPVINYDNTFINPIVEWGHEFFNQKMVDELAYREGTPIPETNFVIGPKMTMELLHFDPQDTIWPANLPLLIIHGNNDTCVPYIDALNYSQNNIKSVKLHTIFGVDHGFDERIEEAYKLTLEWFSKRN